jgi:hypothetical protein
VGPLAEVADNSYYVDFGPRRWRGNETAGFLKTGDEKSGPSTDWMFSCSTIRSLASDGPASIDVRRLHACITNRAPRPLVTASGTLQTGSSATRGHSRLFAQYFRRPKSTSELEKSARAKFSRRIRDTNITVIYTTASAPTVRPESLSVEFHIHTKKSCLSACEDCNSQNPVSELVGRARWKERSDPVRGQGLGTYSGQSRTNMVMR